MANKLYEESAIQDIALAIREKNGTSAKYTVSEMGGAVRNIVGLDKAVAEFSQMNDKVTAYLAAADASYTDSNGGSVSVIANYETAEGDADRPLGYPLTATSGNLYLQNEENGNGWMLSVGTDVVRKSVLNAIPDKVSQYLVKDANGNQTHRKSSHDSILWLCSQLSRFGRLGL